MSKLKEGWEKVKLKEIAEIIMGQSPKSEFYNTEGKGLPFFQGCSEFGELYPETEKWCTKFLKIAQKEDVLMSVRAPVGDLNIAKEKCIIGRGLCAIRTKLNNERFPYYLLKGNIERLISLGSGSVYKSVTKSTIEDFEVNVPPLPVQREIASVLSAYDDMIENNNRRIQILEEMAQTVYKEWFVKLRFPGYEDVKVERTALSVKMVDSELGEIPEGWEVKKFDEIFNIKYGKSLPIKKVSKSGRYPVYGAADIIGYYNEYVCQNKVALVTCRGNGSGDVRRTREPAFITNNSLMVFPKKKYSYWEYFFVELVLRNSNIMSIIGGSAQPQITIEGISTVKAIIPEKESITAFCNLIRPMIDYVDSIYYKNSTLRRTRDLLLPRLISGEIDVSDLDIEVESEKMG